MTLVYQSSSLPKMAPVTEVFDIDQHTGFMASSPPPDRLPQQWEDWEILLDNAVKSKLQVGDKLGLSEEERATSKRWRETVRAVRTTLPMDIISPNLKFWSIVTYVICRWLAELCHPSSSFASCAGLHPTFLCANYPADGPCVHTSLDHPPSPSYFEEAGHPSCAYILRHRLVQLEF